MHIRSFENEQECIPVGCIPLAAMAVSNAMLAPPSCMPPATRASLQCTPPAMHALPPHMPLPHMPPCHAHSPAMHSPCHAHPLPHMPRAMQAPHHACPPPRMPPHHTRPPVNRITDACENITLQLHGESDAR